MKVDLSRDDRTHEEPEKGLLHTIITSLALVAITCGLTFGLVKLTNINAMEPVVVDSYNVIKDEHRALLDMDIGEFFAQIDRGDTVFGIHIPTEKKEKSEDELQEEVAMLKEELQDVIDDATETERELKAQLREATSDVSESRKEIKDQLEDVIRTSEATEQALRNENARLTNHINTQDETIQLNERDIQDYVSTISQLEEDLRLAESREQELKEQLEEMEGAPDEDTNQQY